MKEIKELRWQVYEISQENKILNDKFAKVDKVLAHNEQLSLRLLNLDLTVIEVRNQVFTAVKNEMEHVKNQISDRIEQF